LWPIEVGSWPVAAEGDIKGCYKYREGDKGDGVEAERQLEISVDHAKNFYGDP